MLTSAHSLQPRTVKSAYSAQHDVQRDERELDCHIPTTSARTRVTYVTPILEISSGQNIGTDLSYATTTVSSTSLPPKHRLNRHLPRFPGVKLSLKSRVITRLSRA
jgi:hypothetical protein